MKKLTISFFLIILNVCVFAQSSDSFNYQAIVRNSAGAAVVTQLVSFRLSILKGSATGSPAYSEKHGVTTNQFGLATLAIGNGTNKTGSFDAIDWGADTYFLKVEIDPSGGTAYVDMGTIQLLSVPYALHAKTADALSGGIIETDPVFAASASKGITSTNISNWSTAYGWGNHSGLYQPLSYVPAWADITGKPTLFDGTWSSLTGKPTLFDGTWSSLTGKPTTIAGYGISDAFDGNYNNLTNKPSLFSGSYSDLSDKPNLFSGAYSALTGKPTTLLGYGITDAMSTSHAANGISATNISNWTTAFSWGDHNGLYRPIGYVPTWSEITGKPTLFDGTWTNLTGKPTTIAGYGITDAFNGTWTSLTGKPTFATVATSGSYIDLSNKPSLFDGTWTSLTGKPATIAGYGITDAISTAHPANGITATNITNWTSAFSWGNHAGLYRPIAYIPSWSEITGKPTLFDGTWSSLTGKPTLFDGTWTNISGKPTNIAGYGIADAMSTSHAANAISATSISNWTTAFGWGNHASAGYLTSFTELDPTLTSHFDFTGAATNDLLKFNGSKWVKFTPNYLTSFTELDPVFVSHAASGVTSALIGNWNTAFGWGNHSTKGYFANGGETGGTSRSLGNKDDYSLGFKTDNLTRLFIANDGSVGIGTNTPARLFHISDTEIPENGLDDDNDGWVDELGDQLVFTNYGRLGINTTNPSATLDIAGNVKISDGTQGAGKVLTSDATGVATWQAAAGGGWGLTGNAGSVDGTNFIGTTDNVPFNIKVNNQKAGRIDPTLFNTFFGYQSGNSNTTGQQNTASGNQTLYSNVAGSNATAFGFGAMYYANNTATPFTNYNVAVGYEALKGSTSASANTGNYNTALGYQTLLKNTSGGNNTAIGMSALYSNTTGMNNIANGMQALYSNTEGLNNTANGKDALFSNTLGSYNTAFGSSALNSNKSGSNATAIGSRAMYYANNTTTLFTNTNVAVGYEALRGSSTPSDNSGNNNNAMGYQSLLSNTSGANNTADGLKALYSNTSGSNNTALGYQAGYTATPANANTTGSNNTFIGFNSGPATSTQLTNATAIGYNALVSADNSLVLGGIGSDAVKVGIGVTAPSAKLDIAGNVKIVDGTQGIGKVLTSDANGLATWAAPTVGGSHYIGESFAGGIVFYVDRSGNHGLICSMIDIGTSVWSDIYTTAVGSPGALSDWDGLTNTTAIVAYSSATSAADYCENHTNVDYGTGVYFDWFLPSRGELNHLWNNIYQVQKALDSDGNAATTPITKNFYWTSSEYDSNNGWGFYMNTGTPGGLSKSSTGYVRAIRAF